MNHAETQDAYEHLLPRLDALATEGRFPECLELLDALWRDHGGTEDGGWLRRSVSAHRALVLYGMGRWSEALAEYERQGQEAGSDPSGQVESTLGRATCLSALGRHQEASDVLEQGLSTLPASHTGSALGMLFRLAGECQALGHQVPARYWKTLEATAAVFGIDVPEAKAADPARLADAILAVHRKAIAGPPSATT